jgi:hypothetical protein
VSVARQRIRATHPYAFRSGEWATLCCVVPGPGRDCYLVEFDDGATDFWPVHDLAHGYEFRSPPPCSPCDHAQQ